MNLKILLEENIIAAIKTVHGIELEKVEVFHPENLTHGDYSTNIALILSKKLEQSPLEIAKNLCYEIQSRELSKTTDDSEIQIFQNIEFAKPGFINFVLSNEWLKHLLTYDKEITKYYRENSFSKNVLIEYSQPNPNKPMHIGHARNNFLGSSLVNIFKHMGYKALGVNYMNDWGTHICKSMLMYKKFHEGEEPTKKPDHYVGDLYISYEREEAKNPEVKEEVTEMFRKLENGDKETLVLWKKVTGWAYKGWEKTYKDQNVDFETWFYQSNYKDSGKDVINKAIEVGIAEKDETGAVIARLEKYGIPDKVLLRADGTSVYATQDIQLAKDGYDKYKFEQRLYVVDYRQGDYFSQIFKVAEILGYAWADKLHHVSYGTVELPEGKMSSRKGLVINADDVYEKLVEIEKEEIQKSLKRVTNAEDTARKVALGAFRYGLLKFDPKQNVVFRYDDVSKFEGNTGPYIMYTYARAISVLEKAGYIDNAKETYDLGSIVLKDKELEILRYIYRFTEVVEESAQRFSPNLICNFVFELAQKFNSFYADVPILNSSEEEERPFRLHLTCVTAQVIRTALDLLGIKIVERM